MDLEKAIERTEVDLATVRQACLGQQKALDDATFELTMAAHDAGLLPWAHSHYNPDAWAEVIPLAVQAIRMRDPSGEEWPCVLLKERAKRRGYTVTGIAWLTKRAVDLAVRKDGDPVVHVLQIRAGNHPAPRAVNAALQSELERLLDGVDK